MPAYDGEEDEYQDKRKDWDEDKVEIEELEYMVSPANCPLSISSNLSNDSHIPHQDLIHLSTCPSLQSQSRSVPVTKI